MNLQASCNSPFSNWNKIYTPLPPVLTLATYRAGSIQRIKAICSAYVGDCGSLTWVLNANTWMQTSRHDLSGLVTERYYGTVDTHVANVPHARVSFDHQHGPLIKSEIDIKMTPPLENASLACYSLNASAFRWYEPYKYKLADAMPLPIVVEEDVLVWPPNTASLFRLFQSHQWIALLSLAAFLTTMTVILIGFGVLRRTKASTRLNVYSFEG